MFGEFFGKLVALPVRVLNAPLRIMDKAAAKLNDDDDDDEIGISSAGEDVAACVEATISEMFD